MSACIFAAHVVGRLQRVGPPALHRRRRDEEVDVVRVVADLIRHVVGTASPAKYASSALIASWFATDASSIAAGPQVDVRRHVHDMAGARHERGELVGVRFGAARIGRRFDGVDVEMDRAGVIGLAASAPTRAREHVAGELARPAVDVPVVPRRGIHQRLREQRRRVEIVREALRQLAHRLGVGRVERRALGIRIGGVALRQRLDVGALLLGGGARRASAPARSPGTPPSPPPR